MYTRRASLALLLASLIAACGESSVTIPDASPDGDAEPDTSPLVVEPAPAELPALPNMGACPSGWEARDIDGASLCEPWDGGGPGCAGDDVRFPGESACAPLGPACPARFPEDVVAPALYVEVGAMGGDGSVDAPFGTLAEAVEAATSGDSIVVGAGVFAEELALPDGVTLRGACVSGTIVEGAMGPLNTATITLGDGSMVRDLTVRGQRPGLRADGTSAAVQNVRVEADSVSVAVINGGGLSADGLVVVGTSGEPGVGLFVLSGAQATVDRGYFDGNRVFGVAVGGAATTLTLSRSVVQRGRSAPDLSLGMGIAINDGASLTLEESVVRDNLTGALSVQDGGSAEVSMSVLRGTRSQESDGLLGAGVVCQSRGQVSLMRTLVERNQGAGLSVTGLGSEIFGSDVAVLETLGHEADEQTGVGLLVANGATTELQRVSISGAEGLGVSIFGLDSRLVGEDLVVRAIVPRRSDSAAGRGIDIELEASVSLTRALIEDVYGSAVLVADAGSEATLTDVTARSIRSDARTRSSGRGLTLQFGGCVTATRLTIVNARDAGILAYGEGVEVRGTDVIVDGTLPRECAEDTCLGYRSGIGVTASELSLVDLTRFRVSDGSLAGLQIARGARLVARDGVVARNPVGVNAQDDSFDPSDVSENVQFLDNGINLDSTALPIPEPSGR